MIQPLRGEDGARAVLFDLDGTLVDSALDLASALNRLLAAHGRPEVPLAAVKTMVGDGIAKLVERGFAATGSVPDDLTEPVALFKADYEATVAVETQPFPGVPETLTALSEAGWRLAVVTNKPQAASEQLLAALDLSRHFEVVAGGDRFPVKKPDAGHLLGTLDLLGIPAGSAVMVGDSINDAKSARNAGLPVIAMSYGYGKIPAHDLGADLVLDHFADVPAALARLTAPSP